jgi:hypothetical protein
MTLLRDRLDQAATTESSSTPAQRLSTSRRIGVAAREILLIAALFGLYKYGRSLVVGHELEATHNADLVHRFEAFLHLPSEAALQGAVGSEALFRALNVYYISVHFPLMLAFLVWGFVRRPRAEYTWARNLIAVVTGLALVIHILFPLAPPRFFPQWGFVDTMAVYGPSAYNGTSAAVVNQLAAMPSLHVGWAVLIAYVVARTGPRWLAVVAACHAFITVAVVVLTANHWWLDGVVGVALVALAASVLRPPAPTRPLHHVPAA